MHALSAATLFWLIVPMSVVVIFSLLGYLASFLGKRGNE